MGDRIEWGGTPGPWKTRQAGAFTRIAAGAEMATVADGIVSEANARAIAEVPAMVVALRECAEHITTMLSAIAGGNAEAGQRFAEKDPVVVNIRAILARIDSAS